MLILINNGEVVFQADKDALLETHRIVKGDAGALTPDIKRLFFNIKTTDYGFSGLTDRPAEVRAALADILVERATIDDIMLAYVEGGARQ